MVFDRKDIRSRIISYCEVGYEDRDTYAIGFEDVEVIEYHEPKGDGDRHYVDINYANGTILRRFNINKIFFEKE